MIARREERPSRAIGYVRVSTRDQADNGHSLGAQKAKIEAYATIHNLELLSHIVDDGYSGKNMSRPGMQELLLLLGSHKVDVVIVSKLDRITRSVRDLGELVDRFQKCGVEFASVSDNIDTATASGRLVLNVMASVSQWEREAIGERTSEALAHMRAKGKRVSRFPPFGYRQNDIGEWEEEPHEQKAVRLILRLREEGLSLNKIGAELESRDYLSRTGQQLSAKVIRSVIRRA